MPTAREPQPILSDEDIQAAHYAANLASYDWNIPDVDEHADRFNVEFARRIESLVRRRLAERLRAAKTDGGELAARVVESDD